MCGPVKLELEKKQKKTIFPITTPYNSCISSIDEGMMQILSIGAFLPLYGLQNTKSTEAFSKCVCSCDLPACRQTNLSKQGFVGSLDFLPLGIAARRQQLQDGVLVSPYGGDGDGDGVSQRAARREATPAEAETFPLQPSCDGPHA